MNIIFQDTKDFCTEELQSLFLSVGWSSGQYPEKLVVAMKNSGVVFSAWDGGKLVGLINAMDDGIMNAYIQYLLINPEHQGLGIGKKLVTMIKENYSDYLRIILIAYNKEIPFYQSCGLEVGQDKSPMFITSLWT
ncbi:MAG: acetyltransferase family [Bacteroidetes bacterium]|nr:acetyltransferase family [Bacteroidota bacterium]